MAQLAIVLLVLGIVALAIEMILPGGEIFAIIGAIALVVASVLAVIFIQGGWFIVAGVAVILVAFVCYMYTYMHRKQLQGRLILSDHLAEDISQVMDFDKLLGKEGKTVSLLRPYGEADFEGMRLEVSSEGAMIPEGTRVRVTATDSTSRKITVRPVAVNEN